MFNSIRNKLLLFILIAGCVPLVIVFVTSQTMLGRALLESEKDKVSDVAYHLGGQVTEVMDRSARDLDSIRTNPHLAGDITDTRAPLREMKRLVGVYEAFTDISLYATDGFLICSTSEDYPVFQDYTLWFKEALAGKTVISHPQRKLGEAGLFLTVYLPVVSEKGSVKYVAKARLSFERVMNLLNRVRIGREGSVALIDQWGNIICAADDKRLLEKFDPTIPTGRWISHPVDTYDDLKGDEYLYAAKHIPKSATHVNSSWTLIAMKPMSEVKEVLRETQWTLIWAALITFVVAIAIGVFLARNISRPLEAAGKAAAEVAAGNLDARMQAGGPRELNDLARMFNGMLDELRQHRFGLEKLVARRTESLRRSQAKLLKISAHLRAAINSTNNGFLVEDANGHIALANRLFTDVLGLDHDSVTGKSATIIHSTLASHAELLTGETRFWDSPIPPAGEIDAEILINEPLRKILHVFSAPLTNRRGHNIGRVWTFQDITDQRNLEEGLRQSQKMEAVGQLAGGIAHDFNNLLTGILGNLALVDLEFDNSSNFVHRENLSHAIRAGERAANLVKQLLGFSRRSRMDLKPCNANHVLAEVKGILAATLDPGIKITLDAAPQPWRVMVDHGMLSQVIMNLAVNAKDAMPGGGCLTIRTANHYISDTEARQNPDSCPGQFLRISVQDTGDGIPLEIQHRIFEPFFTTKGQGKGTGLGLATSFGIIKQLGGWLEFHSLPGCGTRFDIFLPRSAVAEGMPEPRQERTSTSAIPGSNHETILIVDDEDVVRRVAETLFTKLGYKVILARDGLEAIRIFETRAREINMVLLDLTMPNLSGKETFRILRQRFAYVPVVICSGYLLDLNEFTNECGARPDGFVQKPYRLENMSAVVRQTIDNAKARQTTSVHTVAA